MIDKIIEKLLQEKFINASFNKIKKLLIKTKRLLVKIKRLLVKFIYNFSKLFVYLDFLLALITKLIFKQAIKIKDNRIVFMTKTLNYTCNPKYICEKLLEQHVDCEIIWITNNLKNNSFPSNVKLVKIHTLECFKAVYSAKIWIDNGIAFSQYYDKKKNQIHIQTMHGSLGIKRLDNAVVNRNKQGYSGRRVVKRETKNTDLLITNSLFEENVFKSVFWKNTPIKRLGHARTDILFNQNEQITRYIKQRIYETYGIPYNKKFVLYGPTYRIGLKFNDLVIDFEKLVEELNAKFNDEYVVLFRFHNRNKKMIKHLTTSDLVYNVTNYPDIQELMLVSDIAITDYSSWIYDFVLTSKPGFIYATDVDRFNNTTGLCYLLEETPFPVAHNNEELFENVRNFNLQQYQNEVQRFLDDKESIDDGFSSDRIVAEIKQMLESSDVPSNQ